MSIYRLLADHLIPVGGGMIVSAGSIQSTADVGGLLPPNWTPSNAVDPLDTAAVTAFFAAGVQVWPGCTIGVNGFLTAAPKTYWRITDRVSDQWSLTGLGAGLGAKPLTSRGMRP
jgi:hypothetical protein